MYWSCKSCTHLFSALTHIYMCLDVLAVFMEPKYVKQEMFWLGELWLTMNENVLNLTYIYRWSTDLLTTI